MTTIGIPVFERVDLLDVTCPLEVLGAGPSTMQLSLKLVSMSAQREFTTSPAISMRADCTRFDAPHLDVLVVPGGAGVAAMMKEPEVRAWLVDRAERATWVTSVCAGALLLGAAGLLKGHSATTHWASLPALGMLPGVTIAPGYPRVVISGNRMTSGGVTSALDLAMSLKAVLLGEQAAKDTELYLQYDPIPPYHVGRPDLADPVTLATNSQAFAKAVAERVEIIEELFPR